MADDAALMRRALEATALGIAHGSGPFGALVADPSGAIVAVAVNDVLVRGDPTAHSEVNAIRRAAAVRGRPLLEGCTLVTTCAPAAFLRARGIAYDADVERAAAIELMRRYAGPRNG